MEHDIGCKIKAARIEKKLTQEQVAELLGVSRQTISNWENEKSYPDIISVIKMSECYDVSLDYLLKGEQKMKSYYDYLEESTNVVKSNANRNKIITILSYLLIWAFAMIVFWFFTSGSDAMGYSLMFLWIISLPERSSRRESYTSISRKWWKLLHRTTRNYGSLSICALTRLLRSVKNYGKH